MRKRLSPVRGWRRRFGTEIIARLKAHTRRDAGPPKRIPPEPQLEQPRRPPRHPTTHPNLMFHYRVFGCLGAIFPAGGCCNLSQTVSDARRQSKPLQTVHKLLPSVANRENLPIQCPDAFAPFPS